MSDMMRLTHLLPQLQFLRLQHVALSVPETSYATAPTGLQAFKFSCFDTWAKHTLHDVFNVIMPTLIEVHTLEIADIEFGGDSTFSLNAPINFHHLSTLDLQDNKNLRYALNVLSTFAETGLPKLTNVSFGELTPFDVAALNQFLAVAGQRLHTLLIQFDPDLDYFQSCTFHNSSIGLFGFMLR